MMPEETMSRTEEAAGKILSILRKEKKVSAWDLKLRLQIPSALVYMAAGILMRDGKAKATREKLAYVLSLNENNPEQ